MRTEFQDLNCTNLFRLPARATLIPYPDAASARLNERAASPYYLGLNGQYMSLNGAGTVEPRVGLTWNPSESMSLSLGYGLHSRAEKTDVYFVNTGGGYVNKGLGFTKAHHFMLSLNWNLSENLHLRVEPYFQHLYDVPVEEGT